MIQEEGHAGWIYSFLTLGDTRGLVGVPGAIAAGMTNKPDL
jgi:hypothetical protein